jgi:hypothetical protein
MDLVGAVAFSPYADLSPLVTAAEQGTLGGPVQARDYIWILQSLSNMDPEFDLDLYRSGVARERWDSLSDCAPPDPEETKQLLVDLNPNDLKPRDPGAAADLRRRLAALGVPANYPTPGSAPVLVAFGTLDNSSPPDGIQRAIDRACAKGERIEVLTRVGGSNASDDQMVDAALGWLYARFAGERLGNVCVGPA